MIKMIFKIIFKALGHFVTIVILSIVIGLIFTPVGGVIGFLLMLLGIGTMIKEETIDIINEYKRERKQKKIMSDTGMELGMHRDEDMEDFGFDSMMKNGINNKNND